MRGYGQFCPLAKASEVIAERWTPLLLRELMLGSHRFSDLQRGLPLMSRTLLTQRLRELEEAGIIDIVPRANGRGQDYVLTQAGKELGPIIHALGSWGTRWSRRLNPEDRDPSLLMWDVQRYLRLPEFPPERTVVHLEFHAVPARYRRLAHWWLVLETPRPDLCLKDPGFDVDLEVQADLPTFIALWRGEADYREAVSTGALAFDGPRPLIRDFPRWLGLTTAGGRRLTPYQRPFRQVAAEIEERVQRTSRAVVP